MKVRYKTPAFQKVYEAMLTAANDLNSELYYNGKPHRGAGHRCAFWDGYAGLTRSANVIPGTLSSVCFAAGKVFAKSNPGILEAVWPITSKERITLSLEGQQHFAEALLNPAEPNEALVKAFKRRRELLKD